MLACYCDEPEQGASTSDHRMHVEVGSVVTFINFATQTSTNLRVLGYMMFNIRRLSRQLTGGAELWHWMTLTFY